MDAAALAGLPPSSAARYKAFLTASYPPEALAAHLGDALPGAPLLEPASRERLLLALSASAKVFAAGLVEEAVALRARDGGGGGGGGGLEGYLSEAWRRRMLEGAPGSGRAREAAGAARGAALRELLAAASHSHAAGQHAGGAKKKKRLKRAEAAAAP
jgi:hypothetical protein